MGYVSLRATLIALRFAPRWLRGWRRVDYASLRSALVTRLAPRWLRFALVTRLAPRWLRLAALDVGYASLLWH
jgi:hypothetical protein